MLTQEEKNNAEENLKKIQNEIYNLKADIAFLRKKEMKYRNYIKNKNKSRYEGNFWLSGKCFKKYNKHYRDLSVEERREYLRDRQRFLRKNKK